MEKDQKEQACEEKIRDIVSDLFRSMLQMEVALTLDEKSDHASVVTATIEFDGAWKGILELGCSNVQAVCFAGRFLQMSLTEMDEEVHDVVGELANIIAGNLKQTLPDHVALGTPTVVRALATEAPLPAGTLVGTYSFSSDVGLFSVRLFEAQS